MESHRDDDGAPAVIVVDAANVVGARADGWWRDRAGAAERLLADLSALAERGLPPGAVPSEPGPDAAARTPEIVVVLEGKARAARREAPGLTVVRAEGEGDDCIVAQVRGRSGVPVLVVTSDRELRRRVETEGADVRGAGWLRGLLDDRDR